jgi:hypothetical protein
VTDELGDGLLERLPGERRQTVEDEERTRRRLGELGAAALPPVSSPASHPDVVAPHDLSWARAFARVIAAFEALLPGRPDQAQISLSPVEVLSTHGGDVAKADRVVRVDEGIDARQPLALEHPGEERLGRARVAARLGPEL